MPAGIILSAEVFGVVTGGDQTKTGLVAIVSEPSGAEVYLDGEKLGPYGFGIFLDIPVGSHDLELVSDEWYWKGEIDYNNGFSIETYNFSEYEDGVFTGYKSNVKANTWMREYEQ